MVITAEQLKLTNLIFLEQATLKTVNSELTQQVLEYKELYETQLHIDSIYDEAISDLKQEIEIQNTLLTKQQKNLKYWKISCGCLGLVLIGACLL